MKSQKTRYQTPSMTRPYFEKRDGTAGASGQFYEIKLAMHLMLHGLIAKEKGEVESFFIGTNIDGIHGFDDVIFKYTKKVRDASETKIFFLQAKHRENYVDFDPAKLFSNISKKRDYNLKNYFDCFRKNKLFFCNTDDKVLKEDLKNCRFILFTNATMKKVENFPKYEIENEDYLGLDNNTSIKFSQDCKNQVFDILKVPLDLTLLIEELNEWILKEQIDIVKPIYQIFRAHLENFVITIDDRGKTMFASEFLEGGSGLNPEIQFLRNMFIANVKTLPKFKNKTNFLESLKEIQFKIVKGHGKLGTHKPCDKIITELTTSDINEFLDKFILSYGQPNEKKLEEIIKRKIHMHFDVLPQEAEHLYSIVYSKIQDWWKTENFYLTEKDNWFLESRKMSQLMNVNEMCVSKIKHLHLHYENTKYLKDCIDQNVMNIAVEECTKQLYYTMICQSMNEKNVKFLFLDPKIIQKYYDTVVDIFESECDVLVINEIESIDTFQKFIDIAKENSDKKIIFIGTKLESSLQIDVGFKNLTIECQKRILDETEVLFQGQTMSLRSIFCQNMIQELDNVTLANIINKEKIVIGKKMIDLGEVKSYHISRMLKRHTVIEERCLDDSSIKIALSGNVSKFRREKRFFDLEKYPNPEGQFEVWSKQHELHWIHSDENRLVWRKSNNYVNQIRNFVNELDYVRFQPQDLVENDERFVIVVGEAGIGKSTLLSSMADLKINQLWKYRFNLIDYCQDFSECNSLNALEFLKKACDMSALEFRLFCKYFECEGKIILFIDGFDEIAPDYEEIVMKLFSDLSLSKVEKIVVTSRLCKKEELEDRLNTFAYHLEPFTTANQNAFLKSFMKKEEKTADKILNAFSCIIDDYIRAFISIPLQLKMVAETFDETSLDQGINVYKIFDSFFKKKFFDIELTKTGSSLCNPQTKKAFEKLYSETRIKRENIAILALYGNHLHFLFTEKEIDAIKNTVEELCFENDDSGIISTVKDGVPIFVHRTYAEFFAADRLVRALSEKRSIKEFLNGIDFFGRNQTMMKNFFDFALCDGIDSFTVALTQNKIESSDVLKTRDKGGRTLLHVAATQDNIYVVRKLLDLGAEFSIVDDVLGWSPLSYADRNNFWGIVNEFLEKGANSEDMYKAIEHIKNLVDESSSSLIHFCSYNNLVYMLNALLKYRPECVNFRNFDSKKTPVHLAAGRGNLISLKFMLELKEYQLKCDVNGCTILHDGVLSGNLSVVRYIAENCKQLNINAMDNSRKTPLCYAVEKGFFRIAQYLIRQGSTLNKSNFKNLLHLCASKSDKRFVKLLNNNKHLILSDDIESPPKNDPDETFLEQIKNAAMKNNITIVKKVFGEQKTLMNRIISDSTKKNLVFLILLESIKLDYFAIVKYFIDENKAWLNIKNENGVTLLHIAASFGNLKLILFLLKNNPDLTIFDKNGRSFLDYAIITNQCRLIKRLLATDKKWVEYKSKGNNSPLHWAAFEDKRDIVIELLKFGADPLQENDDGCNFLQVTAALGSLEMLKKILSINNQWINMKNKYDQNLLHIAMVHENMDVVNYLIEYLDPASKDSYGKTIFHYAMEIKEFSKFKYLFSKNKIWLDMTTDAGNTLLHLSAQNGFTHIVKYLIEEGANPLKENKSGYTPFTLSIKNHQILVLEYLLSVNKTVVNTIGSNGYTLLDAAIPVNEVEIIDCLIEHGACPTKRNNHGYTALHVVVFYGNLDILERMISMDRSWLGVTDDKGRTLLHYATICGHLDIVKYLVEERIHPLIRDDNGYTCLDCAHVKGHFEILQFLIRAMNL